MSRNLLCNSKVLVLNYYMYILAGVCIKSHNEVELGCATSIWNLTALANLYIEFERLYRV